MNGAIIGFGKIAEGHLYAYRTIKNLNITAIVDTCHQRCKSIIEEYTDINIYDSLEKMLSKENIDFVDVCTPPVFRYTIIKTCLEKGLHVIGEKPFLIYDYQFNDLIDISKKRNLILFPIHNYLYSPAIKYILDNYNCITDLKMTTKRIGHAKGIQEWYSDWRKDSNYSVGGILWDHGPHSIYIASHILRSFPKSVSCKLINNNKSQNEDTAILYMKFDNNTSCSIYLSWESSDRVTKIEFKTNTDFVIIENDDIIVNSGIRKIIEKCNSGFNDHSHKDWYIDVLLDFKKCIENDLFPSDSLKMSLIITKTINAAYESSNNNGKIVEVRI